MLMLLFFDVDANFYGNVNKIGDNNVSVMDNTNRYANVDFNVGANVSANGNHNADANFHFNFDGDVNFNARSLMIRTNVCLWLFVLG